MSAPTVDVYVAAGSNVEPRSHLRRALDELAKYYPALTVSTAYRNPAVGFEGEDFINLVVGFRTADSMRTVLERLHAIEALCGRPRHAPKWAPRSMDLDVLLYGDLVATEKDYTVPRPDLLKRAYMLAPLAEIAPQTVHPLAKQTIAELWRTSNLDAHLMTPVSL